MKSFVALLFATLFALGLTACQAREDAPLPEDVTGFATPESVRYDAEDDVYLVSNINGAGTAEDDNGFVSRIAPDGEVLDLKWIDGADDEVTLDAPKGMAIVGDTLYIADINDVRLFERESGAPISSVNVPNAAFLNDVAAASDGTVYITDTGGNAIYSLDADNTLSTVVAGDELTNPNGVTVLPSGDLLVVTFNDNPGRVYTVDPETGATGDEETLEIRQLDGVELLDNGDRLISSWGDSSVVRLSEDGTVTTVVSGVDSPADIGVDSKRARLLIPLFMENKVTFRELE